MERKKTFKFQAPKKPNSSVIEITDDENSCSPVKTGSAEWTNFTRNSTATSGIGSSISTLASDIITDDKDDIQIQSSFSLSTDDVDDLNLFLNTKEEYVSAVESLQRNLDQIGTCRTPESSMKHTTTEPSKSTGKFKFQKPKSTIVGSTPTLSSAVPAKTIPHMFRNVLSQNTREKTATPIAVPAISTQSSMINSQDSAKENYSLLDMNDDDQWDSLVAGYVNDAVFIIDHSNNVFLFIDRPVRAPNRSMSEK